MLYFIDLQHVYFTKWFYLGHLKNSAYFSDNKSKFVSLRRVLIILSFILLTASVSYSQTGRVASGSEIADKIVRLYPNPASTYITFDLQNTNLKGLSLKIFNGVLGKKMYDANNISNKTTITLNDYTRGIYIYQIVDASGKIIESGKFQVSH